MEDTLFRLLEIIAILLPLTGIFAQFSFRLSDAIDVDEENNAITTIQLLLLSAGIFLTVAGIAVTIQLILVSDAVVVGVTGLLLYFAFLLIGVAIVTAFSLRRSASRSPEQQTLSDQSDNEKIEE